MLTETDIQSRDFECASRARTRDELQGYAILRIDADFKVRHEGIPAASLDRIRSSHNAIERICT